MLQPFSDGKPGTVCWQTHFYETGEVEALIEFDGLKPTGKGRVWWFNGVLRSESTREDLTGRSVDRTYSERGDLLGYSELVHGKLQGARQYFRPDGTGLLESTYRDGHLDGPTWGFWPNGTIAAKGQYRDSKKIGIWDYWDTEGRAIAYDEFQWLWGNGQFAPPAVQP